VLADEHPLARDAIRMAHGTGAVLVKRVLGCKAAVASITFPVLLVGGRSLMDSAVVDVLDVPIVRVERTVASSAIRHFEEFWAETKDRGSKMGCNPQLIGVEDGK